MKKMLMVLMMVVTMTAGLFADVKLLPEDAFNDCIVPMYEDTPSIQPQIAYFADTWEDVYEKTGVDKYDWKEGLSMYCDCTGQQFFVIVKCEVKRNGDLGWICLEFPGDGSETVYVADVVY